MRVPTIRAMSHFQGPAPPLDAKLILYLHPGAAGNAPAPAPTDNTLRQFQTISPVMGHRGSQHYNTTASLSLRLDQSQNLFPALQGNAPGTNRTSPGPTAVNKTVQISKAVSAPNLNVIPPANGAALLGIASRSLQAPVGVPQQRT